MAAQRTVPDRTHPAFATCSGPETVVRCRRLRHHDEKTAVILAAEGDSSRARGLRVSSMGCGASKPATAGGPQPPQAQQTAAMPASGAKPPKAPSLVDSKNESTTTETTTTTDTHQLSSRWVPLFLQHICQMYCNDSQS